MYYLSVENQNLINLNIELGLILRIDKIDSVQQNEQIFNEILRLNGLIYLRPYPLDLNYYEGENLGRGPSIRDLIRQVDAHEFEVASEADQQDFMRRLNIIGHQGIILNVNIQWGQIANLIYENFSEIFTQHTQNQTLQEILSQPVHLYPDTVRANHPQRQEVIDQRTEIHTQLANRFAELGIQAESNQIN